MRGLRNGPRLPLLGVPGPVIFLVGVIFVSWAERDFMAELGWDQWPSGTALGPHGWITVLTFLLTGLCQIAFGAALFAQAGEARMRQLRPGRADPVRARDGHACVQAHELLQHLDRKSVSQRGGAA